RRDDALVVRRGSVAHDLMRVVGEIAQHDQLALLHLVPRDVSRLAHGALGRAPNRGQRLKVLILGRVEEGEDGTSRIGCAGRAPEPEPVPAARLCDRSGADGITAHLREDRRHIQDVDIERLATAITTVFNLEMACTDEMLAIATRLRPHQVTLVPERREEITTEGGLDVRRDPERLREGIARLNEAGIRTSLFIAPQREAIERSRELGAAAIELHTGQYAHCDGDSQTLTALQDASRFGARIGL